MGLWDLFTSNENNKNRKAKEQEMDNRKPLPINPE